MIKDWGFWLMVAGAAAMLVAFFLLVPGVDPGVGGSIMGVQMPGLVYNLGKAQEQTLAFAAGATSMLTGAVIYAAGVVEEAIMRAGGFRRVGNSQSATSTVEEQPTQSSTNPYDPAAWQTLPTGRA